MMKLIRIGLAVNHSFTYYRSVLRGIARYAESKPQWLFTSVIPEQQPLQALGRFRPAGLIASVNMEVLVRTLASWRRPVVNVSVVLPGLQFPRVGVDNVRVSQLAAVHFLERGLRHFGFVGPPDHLYSMERHTAFCQALQETGHTVACYHTPAQLPFDPLGRRWDLDRGVYRWLRSLPRPVGLFVPGDDWGVQVMEACRQVGLRVPEDVALLGVDDDDLDCELTRPRLSSVIVPAERIGYEAAALLDRLLAGEKPPAEPTLLPPTGVATRRSTEVLAIADREVVAAVRFIREHAHLPLRVRDVCRQIAVGRRTLERRCRLALGWGLGEEIRRAHLERARRLLARTDLPMKTVAQQAGFSGLRHLGTVFRQELGMPPTAYRRQMRGPVGEVAF
jgi:LacI family transcriptional regulator